jgi:HAD superfamily hydrolase (TIGR01549 family)
MKDKKLIIFDCDGVLFESAEANLAYFNKCLELAGYEKVPDEIINEVQYMSVKQLIDIFIKDKLKAEKMLELSLSVPYEPFISKIRPNFDFEEILIPLREKYYLAVATNRGRSIDTLFKHFNLFKFFHYKISTLNSKPKPDPGMIFKCLDYFYIDKDQVIFIGDSESDYNCAINAGVDFLWFGKDKPSPSIISGKDLFNFL